MAYQTFFEIGGHVIESYVVSEGHPSRPLAKNVLLEKGKQMGIPKPLMKAGAKEIQESSGVDILKIANTPGRAKRAGWAFRTAAMFALADGPIPVGDALAAGLLVSYGIYETGMIVKDTKEAVGR